MNKNWLRISLAGLAAVVSIPVAGLAQSRGGNQAPPSQGQTGNQPGGGRQPAAPPRDQPQQPQQPSNSIPRTIFLSGSVRLADGTTPPTNVVIERVCNGVVRPEAYTDSNGN